MDYINKKIVVSVSGGKDSTAMCLNLLEKGYSKDDFFRVFSDTGWESPETYKYLKHLEKTIGIIEVIQNKSIKVKTEDEAILLKIESKIGYSPMVRSILYNGMFPSGFAKFCTRFLKLAPFQDYFDSIDSDMVNLVGIRREESPARKNMDEWEFRKEFDCWTHRPIINWTEKDVIAIHKRFNLAPNKLYLNGASRVGCFPCIYANKGQVKMLTPDRVEIIKMLEVYLSEKKGKNVTFFKPKINKTRTWAGIDDAIEWSKMERGSDQYSLFNEETPTCRKWGMCGI